MNQSQKFLKSLDNKRRLVITNLVDKILAGNFDDLDVKKLKGEDNLFRVRKGKVRIIFKMENGFIQIVSIRFRDEHTY